MRKLKLALVLPVIQFIVASVLLYLAGPPGFSELRPRARLICWGPTAPAMLFRMPAMWEPTARFLPETVLGVATIQVCFLVGVIVVWYLVGRALDRRRDPTAKSGGFATTLFVYCFLLALGGFFGYAGLDGLTTPPDERELPILLFAWSAGLIAISAGGLIKKLRLARRR